MDDDLDNVRTINLPIKLVSIGDTRVGKSCMHNSFTTNEFREFRETVFGALHITFDTFNACKCRITCTSFHSQTKRIGIS